jgi:hypothetical protein
MNTQNLLKKIIIQIKARINLVILLLSISALLIVFFKIFNLNVALGLSEILILESLFQIAVISSMIYIILFLPSYPVFFVILKHKFNYNFPEKLGLTIVFNQVFYILVGYIGSYLGFPITGTFFFFILITSFSLIQILLIYFEFKNGTIAYLKPIDHTEIKKNLLFTCLKHSYFKILLLLTIFIGLVCILYIVKYSFFFGTDGWGHIYIIKMITDMNYLPSKEYFGAVGFQIFGAVIQLFSGTELIYLPRYFILYTFFVSALIFYNLLMRIFRNNNLAVLGVFLLEFFSLGFTHMMVQFWPTSLAIIQCLLMFFLLYTRLQKFINLKRPSVEIIKSNMIFSYLLIFFLSISAILIHTLVSMVMIISFLVVYLLYFLKDWRRGIDFALLCGILGFFLILYYSGVISDFFIYIDFLQFPWYFYLFGITLGGIGMIIAILRLKNSIYFTSGRFSLIVTGKKHSTYKNIENKIMYPLSLLIILSIVAVFFIANSLFFNLNTSKVFIVVEATILCVFGFWGLFLFQKKPRGKPLLLSLLSLVILFLGAVLIDISLSGRIAILISPMIAIGFVSYVYKTIKTKSIMTVKVSMFLIGVTILSLFAHFYDELVDTDFNEYNLKNREVYSVQWLSDYTFDKNIIIGEFGWSYIFVYYDYPFNEKNQSLRSYDIHYFISISQEFFHPSNHLNGSGVNLLRQLKRDLSSDVFIILDDTYLSLSGTGGIGRLTESEMEQYYNLNYLNKIMSSKSEYGEKIPYYWVI